MSEDPQFRMTISPVPTADEADAVAAVMTLHLNRGNVTGERVTAPSAWILAGRIHAHATRSSWNGAGRKSPGWLTRE
ncbi:MAG: hypothetical protein AB7G88_14380 [Thermomicrobiales bacterium]